MSTAKESAPIEATQDGVGYTLVFVDDDSNQDTVLMRVIFETGDAHEERVSREAADAKLKTLIDDRIDARLHEIISDQVMS